MKTKRINLNELKEIVKQVLKEEEIINLNKVNNTDEKGLYLFPSTKKDESIIRENLLNSDIYAEYNHEFKCFFLPEKEENYDKLESDIDDILKHSNVNYRIEGIF